MSRAAEAAIVTPVQGVRSGVRFGHNSFQSFSRFLENRWGLSRAEKVAVYGTMVGAPLALIAAPMLGFGVAAALSSPAIFKGFRRRSKAQMEARRQIYEQTSPISDQAEETVAQADRIKNLEQTLARQGDALTAVIQDIQNTQAENQKTIRDAVREFMRNEQQASSDPAPSSPKQETDSSETNETAPILSSGLEVKTTNVKVRPFERETGSVERILTFEAGLGAELIDGTRKLFFLTGVSKARPGSDNVIYSKVPLAQIPGMVQIGDVISGTPNDLWEAIGESSGMEKKQFMREARKMKKTGSQVSVVTVRDVKRFQTPVSLSGSGLTKHDLLGSVTVKPERERHQHLLKVLGEQTVVKPKPKVEAPQPEPAEESFVEGAQADSSGVFGVDELETLLTSR